MTDEISIQNPQEKRGNYAVPGLIGGAVVGAGGGYLGAHYKNWGITSRPDLDKVFEQEPDSFSKQIERAEGNNKTFLEAAKEEAQKVKDAKSEYEKEISKLMEGTVKDADIPKDMIDKRDAAQKAYDSALEAEKKNIAKSGTHTSVTEFKLPTPNEVKNLGDGVTIKEINAYETLYNQYNNALKTAKKTVDRTRLNNFKADVQNTLSGIDAISRTRTILPKKMAINNRIKVLEDVIKAEIPDITDAKRIKHEMKLAGKNYTPGSKNYQKFVNELNKNIVETRKAMLNEILGEKIQVDIIDPKTKKVIGKRNTYANVENYIKEENGRINSLNKFFNRGDVKKYFTPSKTPNTVAYYDKELAKLEKRRKSMVVRDYENTKNILNAKKAVAADYESLIARLNARGEAFFGRLTLVKKMNEKIDKAILNNASVQSYYAQLKNLAEKNVAINKIAFETAEEVKLTEAEINQKAVEALKDNKVATDLQAAKDEIDKFAKDNKIDTKLTREEAIKKFGKSEEQYTKEITEKATERLKGLAEKTKFAHKGWTAAAAAVTLGIVGGLIGTTVKKDA